MRFTALLSIVCLHGLCIGQNQPTGGSEHLLPQNPYYSETLRSIVEKKLLTGPANCGRILHMDVGPLARESAISIHCDSLEQVAPCYVISTRALRNIESVTLEHEGEPDIDKFINSIQVKRTVTPILQSTAIAFRSCLIEMMPQEGVSAEAPTISDHDRIEFSIVDSVNTPFRGERGERPGKRVRVLVRVGELLDRYCNENPTKRSATGKQISKELTKICGGKRSK
jgi:hypothetical protein